MKRSIFVTLAVVAMLFTFTACDENPSTSELTMEEGLSYVGNWIAEKFDEYGLEAALSYTVQSNETSDEGLVVKPNSQYVVDMDNWLFSCDIDSEYNGESIHVIITNLSFFSSDFLFEVATYNGEDIPSSTLTTLISSLFASIMG